MHEGRLVNKTELRQEVEVPPEENMSTPRTGSRNLTPARLDSERGLGLKPGASRRSRLFAFLFFFRRALQNGL